MSVAQQATGVAGALADWAVQLEPTADDLALAQRALIDSVAVALAAADEPIAQIAARGLEEAGMWATMTHIVDFDDLHMPSTTHISTVCVPVTLALGGDARDYLVGAGVMARLGTALGWGHYQAGWHATTTAGALAAAAVAASVFELDRERTAAALALAVPASGGVQAAFGTDAKSLQVGLAADAGVRAATLAEAGATADPSAIEAWMRLLGGDPEALVASTTDRTAVPDGLAIKIYPCCYALQRPIAAAATLREAVTAAGGVQAVESITVRTLAGAITPLHHHRPVTGLQAKFSLEYAVATALLDEHSGFAAFSDEAVNRLEAQQLLRRVEVVTVDGGDGLLDGETVVEVRLTGAGEPLVARLDLPPGAPARPPSEQEMHAKVSDCLDAGLASVTAEALHTASWPQAAAIMRDTFPSRTADLSEQVL
ncbi:MAG: MmgE/PrpD family protein [Dermatophilus congolensis]|nr:MmgE/PrpD family protein [Dermatophilus congolensis]